MLTREPILITKNTIKAILVFGNWYAACGYEI